MNSIARSNSPVLAYVCNDLQIAQDDFQEPFDLNHVESPNNTAELENFNGNLSSKRRKIASPANFSSIESTTSRMGVDVLLTQQNPTEHSTPFFNQVIPQISLNERAKNPQKKQKSFTKLTDEDRQELIEAKKSYKQLLQKSDLTPREKIDYKHLILKHGKSIAKNDYLATQEELNSYKAQSELELNNTQQLLNEANNKRGAAEEIYNKKINFLNVLHEQKTQALLNQIKILEGPSKTEAEQKDKI